MPDFTVLNRGNRCPLCSLYPESASFLVSRGIEVGTKSPLTEFFEYLIQRIRESLSEKMEKCECHACENRGKAEATNEVLDICQATPKWIRVCATCEPVIRVLVPEPERWRPVTLVH